MGRTQAEKRYILDTVLDHLPKVTGSKRDMNVYVIQKNGYNSSCSHDEFGQWSNLGRGKYKSFEVQDEYILIVNASLRDREFKQTFREFQNWLCRLAKRVIVNDILVEIKDYYKSTIIKNKDDVYCGMFETPSWCNKGESPTWCEYLMWDTAKNSDYPMILGYKYFNDEENDREAARRLNYGRE